MQKIVFPWKTRTAANGPGSIDVKFNDQNWNLEWEELTEDIKNEVFNKNSRLLFHVYFF